jgi:arabinofuranosyltransferase
MPSASTRIKLAYAIGLLVLVAYLSHCLALNYVIDDSYITFRYARNFVNGHGLVFNPGERVEGYTNFLWAMLLSAVLYAKPNTNLLFAAQVLGIGFGIATIVLVIRFPLLVGQEFGPFCLIAGAFLALNSAFCAWSTAGLETTLFTFLVFAGSYTYVYFQQTGRKFFLVPAIFALAAMTRPEGILIFGVTFLHLAVNQFRSRKAILSKQTLTWLAIFAAIYLPYYFWRLSYYGYPLPNTFYAKVGVGFDQYKRGMHYLLDYVRWYGGLIFLLPLPLLLRNKLKPWIEFFLLLIGTYCAYVIYVGGDGLGFFRFIVPITPFIYILCQEGLRVLYHALNKPFFNGSEWKTVAITCLLLAVSLGYTGRQSLRELLFPNHSRWYEPQSELSFPFIGKDHTYLSFDNYFVDRQAIAAKWLEANAAPNSLVASTPAGSISYNMNLRVIDMLGLNDVHIAHTRSLTQGRDRAGHEKGDGQYVLSRSPDYVLLGNVAVLPKQLTEEEMAKKLVRKSEHEIWADPTFHKNYELVSVKVSDDPIFRYFTFYKKKSLAIGQVSLIP